MANFNKVISCYNYANMKNSIVYIQMNAVKELIDAIKNCINSYHSNDEKNQKSCEIIDRLKYYVNDLEDYYNTLDECYDDQDEYIYFVHTLKMMFPQFCEFMETVTNS